MNHLIHFWKAAIAGDISQKELWDQLQSNYPPLTSVVFTRKCNLQCKHCVYPFANQADLQSQDLQQIDSVIEATRQAGVKELLHVGRILLADHLPILKKYQEKGMNLHLIDNGSAARLIQMIQSSKIFFDNGIDISIDGNERSHELQRGKGSWKMAMDGAIKLQRVSNQILITGTASSLNVSNIVQSFQELQRKLPFVKIWQICTTSPCRHHQSRMSLDEVEMKTLFRNFVSTSNHFPMRLVLYLTKDLAPIIDDLMQFGHPELKHISLQWQVNKSTVCYFPQSIVIVEEFPIDSNGMHFMPFAGDYHLNERPGHLEMRCDTISSNPDQSYRMLARKYIEQFGRRFLQEECFLETILP